MFSDCVYQWHKNTIHASNGLLTVFTSKKYVLKERDNMLVGKKVLRIKNMGRLRRRKRRRKRG